MPSRLNTEMEKEVQVFTNKLKLREFDRPLQLALNTVALLKNIVKEAQWETAMELMDIIKQNGKYLMENAPTETVVGNMTRRVLKIIRDEYTILLGKQEDSEQQESLQQIVKADEFDESFNKPVSVDQLKELIADHIQEFVSELETNEINIRDQAVKHINANEIIMTMGQSKLVSDVLKKAAKDRTFQVIVAECAPFYYGHQLANELAEAKIATTLIPDSAIFGMMSRVNKVLIGTHSVMADGGLKAACGTHTLALAAKHYSVPFIVCAPIFQLCPESVCSPNQDGFNQLVSPDLVLNSLEGSLVSATTVCNPAFDYVPPNLVTLFISNTVGHANSHAPSYIYRLLSELYHPSDLQL